MRLNKFLASAGLGSRRAADTMIAEGRVKVNGQRVLTQGVLVDPQKDIVTLDDRVVKPEAKKYYIALNKPKGVVTTSRDQFGRASVLDLVSDIDARLFPVGRLDYNTSGLLILTNDGDFANKITHPRNEIYKTYIARVAGFPKKEDLIRLSTGVMLEDGMTAPAKAEIIKKTAGGCEIKISICEGRNRQVRRMLAAVGFDVKELKRIAVGKVLLGNLPVGKWRHMTLHEIKSLGGNVKND